MSCLGASANDATRTPAPIISSIRSAASGASARRFTPNGASVRCLTAVTAVRSASIVIVAEPMMPRPPAAEVAAASRAPATKPIPVCTIGYRMPVSSVSRVRIGSRHAASVIASSWSRRASGSRCSRISVSSAAVGSRVCGTWYGAASRKPVASATSDTETPGWTDRSRIE